MIRDFFFYASFSCSLNARCLPFILRSFSPNPPRFVMVLNFFFFFFFFFLVSGAGAALLPPFLLVRTPSERFFLFFGCRLDKGLAVSCSAADSAALSFLGNARPRLNAPLSPPKKPSRPPPFPLSHQAVRTSESCRFSFSFSLLKELAQIFFFPLYFVERLDFFTRSFILYIGESFQMQ